MKWKVAGALALLCVLSMVGCHNDVEKPVAQRRATISTPDGKVVVQSPRLNMDARFATAEVSGSGVNATFRLTSTGDGVHTTGALAELLDESGQLLFAIETQANHDTGEMVYRQATPEDQVTFRVVGDGERIREAYDANGDIAVFEYPALSDEAQRRAVNYYENGVPVAHLPSNVAEYVDRVRAFDTYYRPHATSTIHNNPNGEVLARILNSPDVLSLASAGGTDPRVMKEVQQFCNMMAVCSTFFCRVLPNGQLCTACWGASLACAIMYMACGWIGC